jgi:hypothetical protein
MAVSRWDHDGHARTGALLRAIQAERDVTRPHLKPLRLSALVYAPLANYSPAGVTRGSITIGDAAERTG